MKNKYNTKKVSNKIIFNSIIYPEFKIEEYKIETSIIKYLKKIENKNDRTDTNNCK